MAAVDSFTSQLRSTLILSRSKLDQWVEHQKEQIDVAAEAHRVAVESGQARIDAAVTDLLALQLKGGLALSSSSKPNDKTVSKEVQEILKKRQAIDEQMVELRAQLSDKAAVIQDLRLELIHQRERAAEAKEFTELVQSDKEAAVADLQRGLDCYRQLCLEFERSNDMLRFTFTQLNPKQPSQAFSFHLEHCEETDHYQVHDCEPAIHVEALVAKLNDDDDLHSFIVGMRKAFIATIE